MTDKSLDIEKALAMAAGQDMRVFCKAQIDDADKLLLPGAVENIFQGSSVILWVRGGTLGDAWNTTLDNMRDEFFATSRRDILTVFLQRAVFEHRNQWQEKIRCNDNRAQTFDMLALSKIDTENMLKHAEFQRQQGYDIIKKIIQKYDSGFKAAPKQNVGDAHVSELVHQHQHENEYVRERTK